MPRETFKNKITSEELINQINPINKKLVDKFIKNFKTKRSGGSVKTYISNYNIFFCWNLLYNDNKSFIDIKKYELIEFFDFGVNELKWSPNRYAQVHSSLSSLSTHIENILDEQYPDFRNNMKKIEKTPKENVREKSIFSTEELNNLLKYLGENELYQQQCLLALIMASGARISEILRLDLDVIDLENIAFDGLFLETKKEITVKGRGVNGKKIHRYIIKDVFEPYFLKWLTMREEIVKKNNQEHSCLFIKSDGSPAKVSTLRSWMSKWEDVLGKPWYPHAGRHYWTTFLLSIGLEQEFIQSLQSWSSSEMVSIYNDSTAKDRKWKGLDKLKNVLENTEIKVKENSEEDTKDNN